MKIFLLLCTMILAASGVKAQIYADPVLTRPPEKPARYKEDPASWNKYTVKGEEFSVKLPTVPAMTTSKVFQARLQRHRVERQLKTSFQGIVYTVGIFENSPQRQSLAQFILEQSAGSAYDPKTERELTNYGVPGKEYLIQNRTTPAIAQLFATERRLYQFTVIGAGAEHPGVKAFFFSIVISEYARGVAVEDGPGMPLEGDTGERIYIGRELDAKALLLNKPEPAFTSKARVTRMEGRVVLRVIFHKSGQVINIQVIEGLPDGLTEAAIEAARQIKFRPAQKDGKPVSQWMQLEYDFRL